MRLTVHGPQECDRPAGDDLPLSIDEVVAALHHSLDIVPETCGLGELGRAYRIARTRACPLGQTRRRLSRNNGEFAHAKR